jgi:hypothetical protein
MCRLITTGFVCLLGVLSGIGSTAAGVVDLRIASSADDAEESASGSVSLSSSDLELVNDGSDQIVGLRFPALGIPQGSDIISAWIQFETDEVTVDATSLRIEAEARDSAAAFGTTSGSLSSRPRTTAWVPWSPPPWSTVGEAGPGQRTPDLTSLLQEVIDRPGWVSGNAVVVIVTGTGRRTARARDGSSTGAPLLHVEFAGEVSQPSGVDEVHWTITGPRSVTFDWRGPAAENVVRAGLVSGNLTISATGVAPSPLPDSSAGPFWEARLTGLNPDTLYFYRIGTGPEQTFRTPQAPATSNFWVAAQADIGGPPTIYPNAAIVQQQIATDNPAIPGDDRPRIVLAAGDLSYGDQSGPQAVGPRRTTGRTTKGGSTSPTRRTSPALRPPAGPARSGCGSTAATCGSSHTPSPSAARGPTGPRRPIRSWPRRNRSPASRSSSPTATGPPTRPPRIMEERRRLPPCRRRWRRATRSTA